MIMISVKYVYRLQIISACESEARKQPTWVTGYLFVHFFFYRKTKALIALVISLVATTCCTAMSEITVLM